MLPLFTIRNLSTGYGARQVLFDVCLELRAGEIVVVLGGNGSGKSTLLKAAFGLLRPWNGNSEITYRPNPDGELGPTINPVRNLGNGIALLPQTNAVFDNLSVDNNLHISGYTFRSRQQFIARREEVLDRISAIRPLLRRNTSQLSGGELRLVSLAMVLIHRPRLLLLDEPLSGLDSQNAANVLEIIRNAQSAYAITILMTEHRHLEAATLGGRTCRMRQGRLEREHTNDSDDEPAKRRIL
jgi:ABC-type branched-subunit amino acid transport system ATPase component